MTGRQRVSAIVHKRPADRLCWAPLVDGHTLGELPPPLSRLITLWVRRSNFILGAFADGLAVPRERFQAVAAWVERNGGRS